MAKRQSVTSLGISPEDERRGRFVRYTIQMTIRVACVIGAVFAPDWWKLLFAIGAVFLPYFAVVNANAPKTDIAKDQDSAIAPKLFLGSGHATRPRVK